MAQNIVSISCAAVLLLCSVQDLKNKMINIVIPLIAMILIIAVRILYGECSYFDMLLSVLPGIIILLIAMAGKEMIGFADGIVICFVGTCQGLNTNIKVILLSFAIAWLVIIFEITVAGIEKDKIEIPFVPCIAIAWLCFTIKG